MVFLDACEAYIAMSSEAWRKNLSDKTLIALIASALAGIEAIVDESCLTIRLGIFGSSMPCMECLGKDIEK